MTDIIQTWFENCPGALVAYSGGVDSALVAFLARRFLGKSKAVAVLADSPSLKRRDFEEAKAFARKHDMRLRIVRPNEMADPRYRANPHDRCFHCKTILYGELLKLKNEYPGFDILNGQNKDDSLDYRPGIRAAREGGVRSPLAECEMTKADVRSMAGYFGLDCAEKPASPCLSSRVPYGQAIEPEKLARIEAVENELQDMGFPVVRVRHHGAFARIEVPLEDLPRLEAQTVKLIEIGHSQGFHKIEIDETGFVSGKLNAGVQVAAS